PAGDSARMERASGNASLLDVSWVLPLLPSTPKATLTLENVLQSGALWTQGAGTGSSQATSNAHGNNVATELHSAPEWGPLSLDLGGKGLRRHRADGRIE